MPLSSESFYDQERQQMMDKIKALKKENKALKKQLREENNRLRSEAASASTAQTAKRAKKRRAGGDARPRDLPF